MTITSGDSPLKLRYGTDITACPPNSDCTYIQNTASSMTITSASIDTSVTPAVDIIVEGTGFKVNGTSSIVWYPHCKLGEIYGDYWVPSQENGETKGRCYFELGVPHTPIAGSFVEVFFTSEAADTYACNHETLTPITN